MKALNLEKMEKIVGGSFNQCDLDFSLIAFDEYNLSVDPNSTDAFLLAMDTQSAINDGCI